MAKILIAGCGYVGCELAKLLLAQNHTVYAIRRHVSDLPLGVKALALDLTTLQARDLPTDVDYVFYLAAADESSEQAYYQAYQTGLANLLNCLQEAKLQPKRIVFSSSTAVYAQMQEEWVDESSKTTPKDFNGKILLAAEQLLLQSNFASVVVRFGGIYGPGRERLIQQVASGKAKLSLNDGYTNRIHVMDCAKVLLHLMRLESPETIYLAVDHEPVLKNEVMLWLASRLKTQLNQMEAIHPQEQALRSNKRCSNQRLLASGYRFVYPSFREGYADLLQRYS
ncbi:MAG: epimerase [Gammaproteobacteria bacterium]|jgi:nucleoside-diphosphate-sugar epimerase|nr:epimerase [Gammaproteobacteria bacterium]